MKNKTQTHIPTPWTYEGEPVYMNASIYGPNKNLVAVVWSGKQPSNRRVNANAELIVRAVNHHEELVECLRYLTREINLGKLNIRKDFHLINAHACALKALHKIEGGNEHGTRHVSGGQRVSVSGLEEPRK